MDVRENWIIQGILIGLRKSWKIKKVMEKSGKLK